MKSTSLLVCLCFALLACASGGQPSDGEGLSGAEGELRHALSTDDNVDCDTIEGDRCFDDGPLKGCISRLKVTISPASEFRPYPRHFLTIHREHRPDEYQDGRFERTRAGYSGKWGDYTLKLAGPAEKLEGSFAAEGQTMNVRCRNVGDRPYPAERL